MASESVQILIEAEDKASAKIASATQAIDQNIKSVKDTGAKAKASTEFLGVLAGQLGGTELASYAGQLAGVTEKVGQFVKDLKLPKKDVEKIFWKNAAKLFKLKE